MQASQRITRPQWAWALYDWGNSAFATTVMAGFFPIFFKQYWASGLSATESTFRLGLANSLAGALVLLAAPLVGALADRGGVRKRMLAVFAALGASTSAALYLVGEGQVWLASMLYGLALIGFGAGNVCYDALLVNVAGPSRLDRVSALGFALGYLGGGVLFALNVLMTQYPEAFGLADAAAAVRLSFLLVGLWWAGFTLPLLRWVPERVPERGAPRLPLAAAWRELRGTLGEIRRHRPVLVFLLAYWLYIDGVDTIVRMAVDYGLALGFAAGDLILALLLVQFVGFPAALAFGRIGERIGARAGILIGLAVYGVVTLWAWRLQQTWEFYLLALLIGLVQGGVQALSRSFYARLIPPERAGEFFGFYNMLGKFAAILGPALMGGVALVTGSTRTSMLAVLVLITAGALLLTRVAPPPPGSER